MASLLNITAKEIHKNVPKKLKLKNIREGREHYGDYYLDGQFQFQVTMPNIHGGKKTITPLLLRGCREKMYLNTKQYNDLVKCLMNADDYDALIREKINKFD
ncbi:MAG: hypothetical protein QGD88_03145 [Anaerolineae bacterium]|nr:hypothetical protein [Anaerolineae bacterium]